MSQRSKLPWNPIKRQSPFELLRKKRKIACQLTIKIKEVIMAYAVFKMCSRASTRHASDGFPLIFFFLVAKKGSLSPFLLVRQDQLPTTHTRACWLSWCLPPGRLPTREACTFPLLFTKCEALGERFPAELSLLKSKKRKIKSSYKSMVYRKHR